MYLEVTVLADRPVAENRRRTDSRRPEAAERDRRLSKYIPTRTRGRELFSDIRITAVNVNTQSSEKLNIIMYDCNYLLAADPVHCVAGQKCQLYNIMTQTLFYSFKTLKHFLLILSINTIKLFHFVVYINQ